MNFNHIYLTHLFKSNTMQNVFLIYNSQRWFKLEKSYHNWRIPNCNLKVRLGLIVSPACNDIKAIKFWMDHYIFIISQLCLTSHPRSTVVLLDTGTSGTSREIYSEDSDDGTWLDWMFTIFKLVLPHALNSLGNNFQLEMRLRFFSIGVTSNLCNSR